MQMDTFVALLIPVGILGGIFVYPVLQVIAIRSMRGRWRYLALVPFLPMAYVIPVTIVAFVQQSNLWPILLIFMAPIALIYLLVLFLTHALWGHPKVPETGSSSSNLSNDNSENADQKRE